jgi:hypothetical protein
MNRRKGTKSFDCVKMKRLIQEKIYRETRGMGDEEILAYFRRQVAESRFAKLLVQPPATHADADTRTKRQRPVP